MDDVTDRFSTLRRARACSTVELGSEALSELQGGSNAEFDPRTVARTTGLRAVQDTASLVPDSPPVGVENVDFDFDVRDETVRIEVTVEAVEKSGLGMQAMTGVSMAALNLVQQLTADGRTAVVRETRLLEHAGGYDAYEDTNWAPGELTAAVLVASDRVHAGEAEDRSGAELKQQLEAKKFSVDEFRVCPDERDEIRSTLGEFVESGIDLIATTGGTGPAPRDVTVEATRDVMDRELPGLADAMRSYGRDRLPYAMYTRGIVAQANCSLIVNFPGSTGGVKDGVRALFPGLHHFFDVRGDGPSDQALADPT